MDRQTPDSNDAADRLPDAVLVRLEAADRSATSVHRDVDAAVLAEARAYFSARVAESAPIDADGAASRAGSAPWRARVADFRSRSRERAGSSGAAGRRTRRLAAGLAAAAVVVAALLVVRPLDLFTTYDADDIDRSGRVDILDAFALARMRTDGAPISETRIDSIAARVVALEPGRAGR